MTWFETDVWNTEYNSVHVEHFDWAVPVDGSGFPERCSRSSVKFTEVRTQGNWKQKHWDHYFMFETSKSGLNRSKGRWRAMENSNLMAWYRQSRFETLQYQLEATNFKLGPCHSVTSFSWRFTQPIRRLSWLAKINLQPLVPLEIVASPKAATAFWDSCRTV